jgi:hypothetical protein
MKFIFLFLFTLVCSVNTSAAPVNLDPNSIFDSDTELVNQEVELIQKAFKAKFGLKVTVSPKLIQVDNESEPFGEYSYHGISFGRLSLSEFNLLKKYYQFPTKVTIQWDLSYEPTREYKLVDFLAPKIQPLMGKTMFFGIPTKLLAVDANYTEQEYIFFSSNCWSTVHEILVSDRWPFDFHGYVTDMNASGKTVLDEALGNNATSKEVSYDPQNINAYDYFLNLDEFGILHTAVFIGPGLIFEKVGLGFDRFRVGYHTHIKNLHYRRIYKPIVHPRELSTSLTEVKDDKFWQLPLKVISDKAGNFILDPNNITSKTVTDALIRICTLEDYEKSLCTNFPWESGSAYKLNEH